MGATHLILLEDEKWHFLKIIEMLSLCLRIQDVKINILVPLYYQTVLIPSLYLFYHYQVLNVKIFLYIH